MTRVIIELEFEQDDVTEFDVINYLNEIADSDNLSFHTQAYYQRTGVFVGVPND